MIEKIKSYDKETIDIIMSTMQLEYKKGFNLEGLEKDYYVEFDEKDNSFGNGYNISSWFIEEIENLKINKTLWIYDENSERGTMRNYKGDYLDELKNFIINYHEWDDCYTKKEWQEYLKDIIGDIEK